MSAPVSRVRPSFPGPRGGHSRHRADGAAAQVADRARDRRECVEAMANTSQPGHRTALLASAVALLGLVSACGTRSSTSSAPQPTEAPRTTSPDTGCVHRTRGHHRPQRHRRIGLASARTDGRCHTSELRAAARPRRPRRRTAELPDRADQHLRPHLHLYGYPGAAFVDASGEQLGPGPPNARPPPPGRSR